MYAIEILMNEHQNIVSLTNVMENMSSSIFETKDVNYKDLEKIVDFIKNYSDFHHHGKEEKILFKYMVEFFGPVADKLINNGMLVEHDLARLYVSGLKECIEKLKNNEKDTKTLVITISHLMEYANLLRRHASKEDSVVYTFAERKLSDEIKEKINRETKEFEEEYSNNNKTQLENLSFLQNKYN